MNAEQKKDFIRNNYTKLSLKELANKTGMTEKEVEKEIASLILNKKGGRKFILFLLFPVFILLLAELLLRATGLHQSYPLLIGKEKNGKNYFQLNIDVAKRWFLNPNTIVPQLNNTILYTVDKPDSVFRIIFLGGSTTAGFPYDNLPAFPVMTKLILEKNLPGKRIECVNLGISAINSFSVLDILDETLKLKPDAVVVYMGHNEFYGAFGAASTQNISGFLPVSLVLSLNRLAVVQNLRKIFLSFSCKKKVSRRNKTLMAQMIADTYISTDDERYETARENFEKNYAKLLKFYTGRNIPVITSTLISNLKDHYPFRSRWKKDPTGELEKTYREALNAPDSLAYSLLRRLYEKDSTHAGLLFTLGKLELKKGNIQKAKDLLKRAKEEDGLRFRAPQSWNDIILKLSSRFNAKSVKMDSVFSAHSEYGIPGNNLFLEHLHPNWNGYFLMGETFSREILSTELLQKRNDSLIVKQLESNIWYNQTDAEIGRLKAAMLSSGWPFNNEDFDIAKYGSNVPVFVTEEVFKYLKNGSPWNTLHFKVAQKYILQKNYADALRQYAGVSAYLPEYEFPLDKMGILYLMTGKYRDAFYTYRKLIRLNGSVPYYYCRAGQALAMSGIITEAVKYLEKGIADDVSQGRKISKEDFYNFKFWLGYCYANTGKLYFAERQLRQVLKEFPGHSQARSLLNQILAAKKSRKRVKR